MKLEETDFKGLGEFTVNKAGFNIRKINLEEPWGYIYTTSQLLLKVDQRGPDYVQFTPPGGTLLFKRERFQPHSSMLVWIKTSDTEAFTNFYHPVVGRCNPADEPQEYSCEYSPEQAVYNIKHDSVRCVTRLFAPVDDAVIAINISIANESDRSRNLEVFPVMRPHIAAASLEPWDIPSLYQKIAFSNDDYPLFFMELRNPKGDPEKREYAFMTTDFAAEEAEVVYDSFVGGGSFENPQALRNKSMGIGTANKHHFGSDNPAVCADARQGICALKKCLNLRPGESYSFTIVTGSASGGKKGAKPAMDDIKPFYRYFDASAQRKSQDEASLLRTEFMEKRSITTPDESLNRYVNEWLPLQMQWVTTLDRGWPTGMRGTRDCSEDRTGLIPLDPALCRSSIVDMCGVQRTDGWFPRQFSIFGKHGTHDLRPYVDGGAWLWVLIYDYLCFTKDFAMLREITNWLDDDTGDNVLTHIIRAIEYYTTPENIGEHGLCKIRGGDWNDAEDRAGLEGRGESVLLSCQVVLMLKQAAHLFAYLDNNAQIAEGLSYPEPKSIKDRADLLEQNILTHAYNEEGYLNTVFTDNGEWVFSPHDPDGRRRVSIPANAFGMISGVLRGENLERALQVLIDIKTSDGWPLYWPAIGIPPIEKLGRVGAGDLAAGQYENGGIYNHGSHGFFGRGAARSGHGDLLYKLIRYLLPYDQNCHPVQRSKTAPYGVPNHWKTAPGLEGRGGTCFLSGSISAALRNVYNGMFGIVPQLDGLAIDPDLPSGWNECEVNCSYLGYELEIKYRRSVDGSKMPKLYVDGVESGEAREDILIGKRIVVIPDREFSGKPKCRIECLY